MVLMCPGETPTLRGEVYFSYVGNGGGVLVCTIVSAGHWANDLLTGVRYVLVTVIGNWLPLRNVRPDIH